MYMEGNRMHLLWSTPIAMVLERREMNALHCAALVTVDCIMNRKKTEDNWKKNPKKVNTKLVNEVLLLSFAKIPPWQKTKCRNHASINGSFQIFIGQKRQKNISYFARKVDILI